MLFDRREVSLFGLCRCLKKNQFSEYGTQVILLFQDYMALYKLKNFTYKTHMAFNICESFQSDQMSSRVM